MEPMRSPEEERQLTQSPEQRLKVKLKIQRELLGFLIGHLERSAGVQNEKIDLYSEHESRPAIFLIESISERFAVWFESLCGSGDPDGGDDDSGLMTLEEFETEYFGDPRRVLEAVLAQSFVGDQGGVDEYLRELQEWFKVKPQPDSSGEKRLSVPIRAHMTKKSVHKVLDAMDGSGAESAS